MSVRTISGGLVGLILGLVIGFWGANRLNGPAGNSIETELPASAHAPASDVSGRTEQPGMVADVQQTLDAAKNNPGDVEAQLKAGDMYLRIQRYDEALGYYQKAADLKPDSFEANANIGKVYFDRKQFAKAGEFYEKALRLNGNDPGLRSDFGLTFYLREPADTRKAVEEYRKALEIDPKHEAALQNLGLALNELKEDKELALVLDRLRAVNPDNPALKKLGEL